MQRRTNLVAMLLIAAVLLVIVTAPVAAYYLGRANGSASGHALAKASQEEAHAALTLAEQATDEASHWKLQAEEASATVAELRIVAEDDAQVIEKLKAELAAKPKPVAKPAAKTSTPAAKTSAPKATGDAAAIIRAAAAAKGYGKADTDALLEIARRESTLGRDRTAYASGRECVGLFQLDSAKGSYANRLDDKWNTTAAIAYIERRYGSPVKALAAHDAKGWY